MVDPRTPSAHNLGPNFRERIPYPSRKRRPKAAGQCSGQLTQVGAHTMLAHDLGPNVRDAYHVRRANAGPKKQGDVLGGGHRSVPAHA